MMPRQPDVEEAMVTEADVIMAYRLLLGRHPENDDVVRAHALNIHDLAHLREVLTGSPEFRAANRLPPRVGQALDWPPMSVEIDVPDDVLGRMMARVESEFDALGKTEPHWSVLTAERFRAANIQANEDEFYRSGEEPVQQLVATIERCGLRIGDYRRCFELGCGVGRSTIWLEKVFPEVIAADISASHLECARQAESRFGSGAAAFLHLNRLAMYHDLPAFDCFISLIVLQHNPPPVMALILRLALNRLSASGIAYFQIPTYLADYRFSAAAWLDEQRPWEEVEVHCIPQSTLFDIISAAGCDVLECREDTALGTDAISNRLLVRKR
jgi:SAM-dependent methyltransferase